MVLRPQVLVTENVLTSFIAPAGERNAAMIGTAIWGPDDTVTNVSNMSEFVNLFGDDKTGTGVTGVKGADAFFRNGGTLKFIRVNDGTEDKADVLLPGGSGAENVITFEAVYNGTYGNNITVTVTANPTTSANRDIQITDGKILEVIDNNGAGYATNDAIAAAVSSNSSLVDATVESGQGTINILDATTATALTGGLDGESSVTTTIVETAFDDLLLTEEFNFLLVPGFTTNAFHSTMVGKLNSRASSEKKYSRYLTGVAVDETIATATARTASGKRLSVLAPNVKQTHRIDGTVLTLDGSYLACAYAGMLCALDLETSGTHETVNVEGLSVLASSGKEFYSKVEQEQLLQGRIAPVANVGGSIQMVRGVTRASSTTDVFFDGVIVDIADHVRELCEDYLNTVIGKPNTAEKRAIVAERLDAILAAQVREGTIETFLPSTAVQGASPDTIDADINIKPAFSTNFVNLTINIDA